MEQVANRNPGNTHRHSYLGEILEILGILILENSDNMTITAQEKNVSLHSICRFVHPVTDYIGIKI